MKKFFIIFGVIAVVIGGGLAMLFYSVSQLSESVEIDGGVLVWDVGGSYAEELDTSFVGQIRSSGGTTMLSLLSGLERAATDNRITGLVLNMKGVGADWAKVEEIQTALARFSKEGKPVVAYIDGATTRDYALAIMADDIVMSPEANLMVLGISAELDFMKDVLDKLGMEADFVHVGQYKSAPERMTRTEASEANREMISSIVDDRYDALVGMIAGARSLDRNQVELAIDRGMFDAPAALTAGLADTTLYYQEMMDWKFLDEPITTLSDYLYDPRPVQETTKTVAVVYMTGVIMPGTSRFDNYQGKIAGSETVVEELIAVAEDDDIDALIMRIDSPGGSALASDLIWKQMKEVQKKMPVIVSMSGMAASGGYYVACMADSIFADPGTLTGSIGVYGGKMSRTAMYEKIGVNREFITRGENALLFSDEGTFSDYQREIFEEQMGNFYQRFLSKVADGRGMSVGEVHEIAQGRVWTGRQGLEVGLVDELGGMRRAFDSVKYTLGLDRKSKISVVTFGEELSMVERMLLKTFRDGSGFGALMGQSAFMDHPLVGIGNPVLPSLMETLKEDGTFAAMSLMDGTPVAMAPFWIRLQ
jgi:protease IV